MKLILANNQSEQFVKFYSELQAQTREPFEYAGYRSLLFYFSADARAPIEVTCLQTGRRLNEYDGVYINGYLSTYELAAGVAISCQVLNIGFVNQELADPPSLSKLTMSAKLAAAKVPMPRTFAGTKSALLSAVQRLGELNYPVVIKRADADRGIDNFKLDTLQAVTDMLERQSEDSLWLVQEFIANNGFYLVSFYGGQPEFSIFRRLEQRPDKDARKAHMYKPRGGSNASLLPLDQVPASVLQTCRQAVKAMNRQIASVDCLYDPPNDRSTILEVNYNPQLVTIETFKEQRVQALLNYLPQLGKNTGNN